MAITKTDIANEALILLGKDLLVDVDTDLTPAAEDIRAIYESSVREVLSDHDWSFATREAQLLLAPIPVPEITEFEYYYELPSDYINLIQVGSDYETAYTYRDKYRVEAGYLLCNLTDPYIKYVAYITELEVWPRQVIQLLILKIAAKIGYKLTNSQPRVVEIKNEYENKLISASGRDQKIDKSFQYDDDTIPFTDHNGYLLNGYYR